MVELTASGLNIVCRPRKQFVKLIQLTFVWIALKRKRHKGRLIFYSFICIFKRSSSHS